MNAGFVMAQVRYMIVDAQIYLKVIVTVKGMLKIALVYVEEMLLKIIAKYVIMILIMIVVTLQNNLLIILQHSLHIILFNMPLLTGICLNLMIG